MRLLYLLNTRRYFPLVLAIKNTNTRYNIGKRKEKYLSCKREVFRIRGDHAGIS